MAILDKLLEKKDLEAYIEYRSKQLRSIEEKEVLSQPENNKELIRQRFVGRLAELNVLKSLIKQNKIKQMGKTYFAYLMKEVNAKIVTKEGI